MLSGTIDRFADRSVRQPPPVTDICDWELWACARQQIVQHGTDAAVYAAMRCDKLLADGDLAGHRTWLAILNRIGELSGRREGEICH